LEPDDKVPPTKLGISTTVWPERTGVMLVMVMMVMMMMMMMIDD